MSNIYELSSREFEVLAANYAKFLLPDYQWKITKATGDYNRDFEAVVEQIDKWGEAKLTKYGNVAVSKSRWDPTILSAVLKNSVDELILVTSGWIPLEYIIRACHMAETTNNIKGIVFINGYIINEWLRTYTGDFDNFDEDTVNLNIKHIESTECEIITKCLVQIYDMYNILEPTGEIFSIVPYRIHIAFFVTSNSLVEISIPKCFKCSTIDYSNLSNCSVTNVIEINENNTINFTVKPGYHQVVISGNSEYNTHSAGSNIIEVKIDEHCVCAHSIAFKEPPTTDDFIIKQISEIEKVKNNCIVFGNNSVVRVTGVSRNDITSISNQGQRFFYFNFGGSYCQNAMELCKVLSLLQFGIYDNHGEKNTVEMAVNSTLNYCPTYLSNILIGAADYIYAVESVNLLTKSKRELTAEKYMLPEKSTVFIEISDKSDKEILDLLETQLANFVRQNNASTIIISNNHNVIISSFLTHSNLNEIQIIDDIKAQGVITEDNINSLQRIADKYYEQTDFFKAKFFYDLIYFNSGINYDLFEVFKYADSLNHCGSMLHSKEMFLLAAQMSSDDNEERELKILEAQTELFNLRFWSLDVSNLVNDINSIIEKHSNILLKENCGPRALYAYYNCLNRKMVTQYLIGDYKNAEVTFNKYVNSIRSDGYANYKAFAYMDSARGLYAKDIRTAKKRLSAALEILKELSDANMERRRYLDCNVEMAYVDFIIKYESDTNPDIHPLELAVAEVRIRGYKNMLLKCNLKLAACYLALGDMEKSKKCLKYVYDSCNFKENPRVEMFYNNLLSGYLSVTNAIIVNKYGISKEYQPKRIVTFDINVDDKISIEPRLW